MIADGQIVTGKRLAIQVKFRYLPEAVARQRTMRTNRSRRCRARGRRVGLARARSTRRSASAASGKRRRRRSTACAAAATVSSARATSAPRSTPAESDRRRATRAARAAVSGGSRGARLDPSGAARAPTTRIDNLVEAIGIVEDAEGEYSPTLIEYYRGLGRTYIKAAQYQQAIVTLEQAQHISQRHLGLFNVEQAALLDDITTAYLGLGNTTDAQKMQVERLDNAIRRFGAADPRVIPFRYTLAKYYEQSRLPESAREQYQEVLRAQETRLGGTDAGLLAPLRELVALDLLVAQGADPERRDRLAAVLEQNQNATAVERGLSLALLGDWATVTGDAAPPRDYYAQAWSALRANPEVDVAAYFRKPTMIDFVAPLSSVDRNERSRPYTWAEIVLEFDVSAAGLPSDVRVVTRDPQTTRAAVALQPAHARDAFSPALGRRRARRDDERALDALRAPLRQTRTKKRKRRSSCARSPRQAPSCAAVPCERRRPLATLPRSINCDERRVDPCAGRSVTATVERAVDRSRRVGRGGGRFGHRARRGARPRHLGRALPHGPRRGRAGCPTRSPRTSSRSSARSPR